VNSIAFDILVVMPAAIGTLIFFCAVSGFGLKKRGKREGP